MDEPQISCLFHFVSACLNPSFLSLFFATFLMQVSESEVRDFSGSAGLITDPRFVDSQIAPQLDN